MQVDWDLSGAHTLEQVDWPEDRLDAYTTQLKPVDSVRIRLPAGKVLTMDERASDVTLYRRAQGPNPLPGKEGEVIEKVEVVTDPQDVEDAYRLALDQAAEFDLPRKPIEAWRKRRDQGVDDATDRTATGNLDRRIGGKDGPIPNVEPLYSSNDQRPWRVMVQLTWLGA